MLKPADDVRKGQRSTLERSVVSCKLHRSSCRIHQRLVRVMRSASGRLPGAVRRRVSCSDGWSSGRYLPGKVQSWDCSIRGVKREVYIRCLEVDVFAERALHFSWLRIDRLLPKTAVPKSRGKRDCLRHRVSRVRLAYLSILFHQIDCEYNRT